MNNLNICIFANAHFPVYMMNNFHSIMHMM